MRLCDICFDLHSIEYKTAEQKWSFELPSEALEGLNIFTK